MVDRQEKRSSRQWQEKRRGRMSGEEVQHAWQERGVADGRRRRTLQHLEKRSGGLQDNRNDKQLQEKRSSW